MAYIISYDLDNPGQNYKEVETVIESYGTYAKITESCWCIVTSDTAKEVRDNIGNKIDSNDKLFVGKLSGEAAWSGLDDKVSNWLHNNL